MMFAKQKTVLSWFLLFLALTPLMVYKNGMFPYISGKVIFIRLVLTFFLIFFAWFLFKNKEFNRQAQSRLGRNPLVVATTIFLLLALISSLTGVNLYRSLFGNIERGEGLLSLIYFWTFFIGAFLLFEKKDWLTFFQLTLLVGTVVVSDTLFDFLAGDGRPDGHLIGNPAFIAAYLIFVIFTALAVWNWAGKKTWKIISGVIVLMAVGGILLTKTRGAVLGLGAGLLAVLIYAAWYGKEISFHWGRRALNLRILAGSLLLICGLAATLFVITIDQPIWKNIPGLDRLVSLSNSSDPTIQTRLISAGSSLASVNPSNENWTRFLLGWGPENFGLAYDLHYNPAYFQYSTEWFDKAHNQVLDVLVANGLLGLLAYLSLWGLAVYGLLKFRVRNKDIKSDSDEGDVKNGFFFGGAGIFFATAYFVQNFTLFDQITTYIPVFAFMALIAQVYPTQEPPPGQKKSSGWPKFTALTFAILLFPILIWQTLIPASQMKQLLGTLKGSDTQGILLNLDRATQPYTYAQLEIRSRLVQVLMAQPPMQYVNDPVFKELFDKSLALLKESTDREQYAGARFLEVLGHAYTTRGTYATGDEHAQYLTMGEDYLRSSLERAPDRQTIMVDLTHNLILQGKFSEVETIMGDMLALGPTALTTRFEYGTLIAPYGNFRRADEVLDHLGELLTDPEFPLKYGNAEAANRIREAYQAYLIRFYQDRDSEAFLDTMRRAARSEKLIDEGNAWRLEKGLIDELPESQAANMEKHIEMFLELSWDSIRL